MEFKNWEVTASNNEALYHSAKLLVIRSHLQP